jgi:hypothetical protein
MRQAVLLLFIVLPGVATVCVCGYFLFSDWAALSAAFTRFERVAAGNGDLRSVFIAQSLQQTYRINCFADGLGVLLGAILAAIGVHGLCTLPPPTRS